MTDPDANLRHRFDFGASPSWTSFSATSSSQKDSTTSANSFQSSPARSLPGAYIPTPPDDHVPQEPLQYNATAPEPVPLNARYATTVEDVPDLEEENVLRVEEQVVHRGNQNTERTCRICLSGAEDGRLISPCRCRGTMKFVHLHCLNSWRYASPNRRSVYQCDQCGYKYHFNRTHYAAIASSIYTRILATITVFLLSVFISGFIFKLILYITGASLPFTSISALLDLLFGIDPIDEMSSFDLDTWGYRPPQTLREVFFEGFGDAAHWALGVIGLALWGFVSVMTGLGAFGVHLRLGGWRRGREDRRRRGTMGGIMWGIVILVGTAKMLRAIYRGVDAWIRIYQARLETAILEVDPEGE